jgi:hypothetical protein
MLASPDMQEIEIDIEDARKTIELGEIVKRLEATDDFRTLVLEGYFRDDAARVVMLKSDPEFQTDERQYKLDRDILGISVFGEYLRTKKMLGTMAQEAMESHEQTREELIQESV